MLHILQEHILVKEIQILILAEHLKKITISSWKIVKINLIFRDSQDNISHMMIKKLSWLSVAKEQITIRITTKIVKWTKWINTITRYPTNVKMTYKVSNHFKVNQDQFVHHRQISNQQEMKPNIVWTIYHKW